MGLTVPNEPRVDYWVSRKRVISTDTIIPQNVGLNNMSKCPHPFHCRNFGCERKCMQPDFVPFPKIPRFKRSIVITEKIDGTNASITVLENGTVLAGSRTRWITPEKDNAGFARWVKENEDVLRTGLGFGTHFGEWWGQGIQRRYGLNEKRFSLFNTARWHAEIPPLCSVVPVLYAGDWSQDAIETALKKLRTGGSVAAPGFMNPEGIVVFHSASRTMHKVTLENDDVPKGKDSE